MHPKHKPVSTYQLIIKILGICTNFHNPFYWHFGALVVGYSEKETFLNHGTFCTRTGIRTWMTGKKNFVCCQSTQASAYHI